MQEGLDVSLPLRGYPTDVLVLHSRIDRLLQLLLINIAEMVANVAHNQSVRVVLDLTKR